MILYDDFQHMESYRTVLFSIYAKTTSQKLCLYEFMMTAIR